MLGHFIPNASSQQATELVEHLKVTLGRVAEDPWLQTLVIRVLKPLADLLVGKELSNSPRTGAAARPEGQRRSGRSCRAGRTVE